MDEIKIFSICLKEEVEKASSLLTENVVNAMLDGLPVTALLAVTSELAVGAIAGFINHEFFEISSIFVEPDYRRQGVGKALIQALEKLLSDMDISIRVQYTLESHDQESLFPFLRKMGYEVDSISYPDYFIGYVKNLKIDYRSVKRVEGRIQTIAEIGKKYLTDALKLSRTQELKAAIENFLNGNIDRERSLAIARDGLIRSYVTLEDLGDNMLLISDIWSGRNSPDEMAALFVKLVYALKEDCAPEMRIAMLAMNEENRRFIDRFFDKVEDASYRMIKL